MKTRQVIQTENSNNVVWFGSKKAKDKTFANSNTLTFIFNNDAYSFNKADGTDYFDVGNVRTTISLFDENNARLYDLNNAPLIINSVDTTYDLRILESFDNNTHKLRFDLYHNNEYYQNIAEAIITNFDDITFTEPSLSYLNIYLSIYDITFAETGKVFMQTSAEFVDSNGNDVEKKYASSYTTELEAIRQFLIQHLSVIQHELWYNYLYGLPLTQKGISKAMIDAEVISIIMSCAGVQDIQTFDSYIQSSHIYSATFEVLTIYGNLTLSI